LYQTGSYLNLIYIRPWTETHTNKQTDRQTDKRAYVYQSVY